jgi:type I restriction enzyme S subunit
VSGRRAVAEANASSNAPLVVPEGWQLCRLGSLAALQAGYAFKSTWFKKTGVRLLRGTNIEPGSTRWDDVAFVDAATASQFTKFNLSEGDIVIAMDRPVVSRGLKVAIIRKDDLPALLLQRVGRFQLGSGLDPAYFYAYLNGPVFLSHIQAQATGTQLPHVSGTDIESAPVPTPDIGEQRRIVAKLTVLQASSRRAREALDSIPPLLEKLRQSILAAAFRGDLTKHWRAKHLDVEPASELLKRIRIERRKKWEDAELAKMIARGRPPRNDDWLARYSEPAAPDLDPDLELPARWQWSSLEQTAWLTTGSTPPSKVNGCYDGDLPFFKPTDLDQGRSVSGARQYLSAAGCAHVDIVPAQSVLLTCIGATIGKVGLSAVAGATNQQINAATPVVVSPTYLYWYVRSSLAQRWIAANASATTLPILNKGRLCSMPVPICSRTEQDAIAQRVDELMQRADGFASLVASASKQLARLDASTLAAAFRGELGGPSCVIS